jgi:DNA-binding LacI/PurR family transcriptional regulator
MKKSSPKKDKIGLREIAAAAQVSVATVSRVLNGNSSVAPEIQKVVMDAVATFDVDLSRRNKAKSLVFLLGNQAMIPAFHSPILIGADACCAAHGWDLLFLSFSYSRQVPWKELHLPKIVQRHDLVRGVILAGTHSTNLLELLTHKGINFVVLGNNILDERRDLKKDVVFSDDIQGGQDITRYLVSLGHRYIWFVGNSRLPWFARCFEGYSHAMSEAGLTPHQSNIDSEDNTAIGYLGTKSILASGEPVTAIFAGNDPTAHGTYKALREAGLRIPDDISVVGCNDTLGSVLYPALTTIREFPEQLGRLMVELLLNRIAKPDREPQIVAIPTEFIKRDSAGPARAPVLTESDKIRNEWQLPGTAAL